MFWCWVNSPNSSPVKAIKQKQSCSTTRNDIGVSINDWLYRFLERNDYSIRTNTHIAQKNLPVDECQEFVDSVNQSLFLNKVHDDFIVNMDQTGVYFDNRHSRVIADTGCFFDWKQYRIKPLKSTVFLAVSKSGRKLKPLIVFQAKPGGRIQKELKNYHGFGTQCVYAVQEKGWTDTEIMHLWIDTVWIPYANENYQNISYLMIDSFRVCLLIDWILREEVHFVESVTKKIMDNRTILQFIPGGGTSKLHLMWVSTSPLKTKWKAFGPSAWWKWFRKQKLQDRWTRSVGSQRFHEKCSLNGASRLNQLIRSTLLVDIRWHSPRIWWNSDSTERRGALLPR